MKTFEAMFTKSRELYARAVSLFPGGVNSPVRLMKHLPYPIYVKWAYGPYIETVEGHKLIDYCMAFGPLILGHAHPAVREAVCKVIENGWLFGIPTELEIEYGETIRRHFITIEMMRIVNTGTEATMNAIRLARAYTGRKYIVKFDGCYHGAHDYTLVKAGSGAATWGVPTSAGVLEDVAKYTLVLPYNDVQALERTFRQFGNEIAAVIVEPVVGNFGLILPEYDFLRAMRQLCDEHGAVLIFDEVITGFRLALGGAQEFYNIRADLTTLGKIAGGGFPIGIFGGKQDIMRLVTPSGPVYNAGTFNAHPVSLAAGLATIRELEKGYPYSIANSAARKIAEGIQDIGERHGFDLVVKYIASMFQLYFTKGDIKNADDVRRADEKLYLKLHEICLRKGLYLTPSQYEVNFTSAAHTDDVVNETLRILEEAFRELKKEVGR